MQDAGSRPGAADLAILVYAGALLVLWSPALFLGLLTPRIAVLLVGLGPGLVVLAGLVRRRDQAARWAAAYLAWALLAVFLADHPRLAVAGPFGLDVGWVYLAGYVAAWALGRRLTPAGRLALPWVLVAGVGINALFALIEAAVEPVGDLATESGRVHGLVSNSLFLGGLLVGALALLGHLAGSRPARRVALAACSVPFAMAVNLTGSRAALVGGAVLAVLAAVVGARQSSARAAAAVPLVAGAMVLGFVLSLPLQSAESGATRLGETSASSGYQSRSIMWRLGVEAAIDRPIAGWGPGRFGEATAPRVTAEFTRAEGPDKLFYDAHNLVVEQLVTVGVVGLVLLGGFVVSVVRRSRGPLLWFGAGIALTWLFNPVSVCTGGVALLALGAAWSRDGAPGPSDVDEPPSEAERPGGSDAYAVAGRAIGAVLAAAGLVVGVTLLRADALLDDGVASGDLAAVRHAEQLFPPDAVVTGIVAEALGRVADEQPTAANRRAVVAASRRATQLDPTRAYWWIRLGAREYAFGEGTEEDRLDRAEAAFRRALTRNPWSVEAMIGLRGIADARGDAAEVERLTERLCYVNVCLPPDP